MVNDLPSLKRENIPAFIYREVKQRLMTGQLRPGEALTLRTISESTGVSQTPVREALLQLVSERSLVLVPGRSVQVPTLSRSNLVELQDIRLELECLAARRAVDTAAAADGLADALTAIHGQMIEHKRAGHVRQLLELNFAFHFRLYAVAQMPTLLTMVENLWAQMGPYLNYIYRPPYADIAGGHPHDVLVQCLRARDAEGVVREIRRDILGHGQVLLAHMEEVQQTAAPVAGKGRRAAAAFQPAALRSA